MFHLSQLVQNYPGKVKRSWRFLFETIKKSMNFSWKFETLKIVSQSLEVHHHFFRVFAILSLFIESKDQQSRTKFVYGNDYWFL